MDLQLPCDFSEDPMGDFFDSIELLDDVELGDIDLSVYGAEKNLENSDSDSGISVTCENGVVNNNPLDTQNVNRPDSDCVLTDAVGGFQQPSITVVPSATVTNPPAKSNTCKTFPLKPIRVVTINQRSTANPANKPIHKIIPVHQIKPSHSPSISPTKNGAITNHTAFMTSRSPEWVTVGREPSPPFKIADDSQNPIGRDAFLDAYDPGIHSDSSLENHLREFCGTVFSRNQTTPHTQRPDLASPYLMTPTDCVFARASLERLRKKQERMIKNRHAASISRLRKKEYLERLEMRYEQLKRENLNLWRQNEEWRVRCERLESCVNNLQAQIDQISPNKEQSSASPNTTLAVQSSPTTVGLTRFNLSTLSSSTQPVRNGTWLNEHDPETEILTKSAPTIPAFLNPKLDSSNYKSPSVLRSRLATGVINRHPYYHFSPNRPKLVATTALLSLCCLFALNMVLPPLTFAPVGQSLLQTPLDATSAYRLQSTPLKVVGQRRLLSVQDSVTSNTSGGRIDPPCPSQPVTNSSGPFNASPHRDNMSFSDSDYTWRQWVIRNNRLGFFSDKSLGPAASLAQTHPKLGPAFDLDTKSRVRLSQRRRSGPELPHTSELVSKQRSAAVGKNLRPFFQHPFWNWDDLLEAAGRRNDTVYLILAQLDSMYLHAVDPIYENLATKITLIVPAYSTPNGTKNAPHKAHARRTMLQVECELRNVTLLHPPKGSRH